MHYYERLERKLQAEFHPVKLEIHDDSNKHHGHSGAHPSGETHFRVVIVSEIFRDKTRIARQRMVHKAVEDELHERVHALQLKLYTPEEYAARGA